MEYGPFLLAQYLQEKETGIFFASGGSAIGGINGVGSGGNGEGVAVEVEEQLTMVAKMVVGAMVLHAGQFSSHNNQVTLGVVLSSLC